MRLNIRSYPLGLWMVAASLAVACGSESAEGEGGSDLEVEQGDDSSADTEEVPDALPDVDDPDIDETHDDGRDGEADQTGEIGEEGEDVAGEGEEGLPPIPGIWEQVLVPNVTVNHVFRGLSMSGADQGHIVGASGVAIRFQDKKYTLTSEGVFGNLNAVWGSASNNVWAVGIGGLILQWDGLAWRTLGGCAFDADCDDGDSCTNDVCGPAGTCQMLAVPAGPGCCGTSAYAEGFDSGVAQGWTFEPLYPQTSSIGWQVLGHTGQDGVARNTSPPNALYFGNPSVPCPGNPGTSCPNYDGGGLVVGGRATSPPFIVPVGASVQGRFQLWLDVEDFAGVDLLTVSAIPTIGVPAQLWQSGKPHANFQQVALNLSAYAGQEIQLRFTFDSVDAFDNFGEGIYIDDLQVEATCGQLPTQAGPSLATSTLFDVWGTGPNNIYAAGLNGAALRFNGSVWAPVDFGSGGQSWSLNGVFGANGSLVAVGEGGLALGGAGGSLAPEPTPSQARLNAVWGTSPNEMFAVGGNGTILRRGNAGWVQEPAGTAAELRGVWGAGAFAVVAVGTQGTILRRVEGNWFPEFSSTGVDLNDVWAQGSGNIWAVGEAGMIVRDQGAGWQQVSSPATATLRAIHGTSADSIYAVGDSGTVIRWDGAVWSNVAAPGIPAYSRVWASPDGRVMLAAPNGFVTFGKEGDWKTMEHPFAPAPLRAIWGDAANNVFAVGEGFVLRYDGNAQYQWKVFATSVEPVTWRGICGSGPDNVMLVGAGGTVVRYNGTNWVQVPVQPDPNSDPNGDPIPITDQLYGCHAIGENQAWAVGENGVVLELVGGRFVRGNTTSNVSLRRVYAHNPQLIFAIGIEGFLMVSRGQGQPWVPMFSGSVAGLFDIEGTSLNDITIVGDRGTILRFVPNVDIFGSVSP